MEAIDKKAMYVLAELYVDASISSAHVCLAKSLDLICTEVRWVIYTSSLP